MEIQLWREKLNPYDLAVEELLVKFRHIIKEHRSKGMYSPIEHVSGRVKKLSSIIEKMQRKGITFEEIDNYVEDIAGLRIICQFVEDIDRVVELIKQRTDMEVLQEKDYISNIKESGYRSYHLIVSYTVQTMDGNKDIKVEIQIRTMAMDFWSTVEHSLQYKYQQNIPVEIRERLHNASDAIIALDSEMSAIRSEIMDAQNQFQIKANIVEEILNNIQNLYHVANEREIVKIQDEFYKLYSASSIDELKTFSRELDIIAEGYRAQS